MMDLKTPRVLNPFRFLGSPNGAGRRIVGRRRRRYAIYAGARFAVSDEPVFHPAAPVRIIAGTPNPQMKRWQRIASNLREPRFWTMGGSPHAKGPVLPIDRRCGGTRNFLPTVSNTKTSI